MELIERVKHHFGFNAGEIKALLTTIFVYGLILSFSFEMAEPNLILWLKTLIPSFLIAALGIIVYVSAIRIAALKQGYMAEFKMNYYVMSFIFILSIVSRGHLFMVLPGIMVFHMLEGLRLGGFRYGINLIEIRWPIFIGSLSCIILALFFRVLSNLGQFAGNPLLEKVILVNLSIATFSLIPLPDFPGLHVLISSRLVYAFASSLIFGAAVAIFLNLGFWVSVFIPLVIGIGGWLIAAIFESK